MKEVKFRAWDTMFEKMLYMGELHQTTNISSIMIHPQYSRFKLMQYTGLHDKNGKEIYEGDIVKCGTNKVGVVEYDPYEALYHVGNDPLQYYVYGSNEPETMRVEIETIGNIYDNPELIKGEMA